MKISDYEMNQYSVKSAPDTLKAEGNVTPRDIKHIFDRLPEFIAQKKGHIIVTSSRAGTMSVPGNAVYCGTKHFVRAMLDSFRSESIREGTNIRTTTIYPGAIKTELLNAVAESEAKNMISQFYENVGLTPDVIANAVLYAVSQPDNVAVPDLVVCPSMEG